MELARESESPVQGRPSFHHSSTSVSPKYLHAPTLAAGINRAVCCIPMALRASTSSSSCSRCTLAGLEQIGFTGTQIGLVAAVRPWTSALAGEVVLNEMADYHRQPTVQ